MKENDHYTALDRLYDGAPRNCDSCGTEAGEEPLYSLQGFRMCAACLRTFIGELTDDELAAAVGAEKELPCV